MSTGRVRGGADGGVEAVRQLQGGDPQGCRLGKTGLQGDACVQGVADLHDGAGLQSWAGVHGRACLQGADLQGAGWYGKGGVDGGLLLGQAGHWSSGLVPNVFCKWF